MARILTIEISGFECIGDSRPKINTNFENLDTSIQTLSTYTINQVLTLSSYDKNIIDPVLTVVRSNSASWEESADIVPTVTNYLSTNNVFVSTLTSTAIRTNSINVSGNIANTGNIVSLGNITGSGNLTINNITATGFVSSGGNITTNSNITALGNIFTRNNFLSAGQNLLNLFKLSGPIPLSSLSDIVFTNLSANQVLRFDGGIWRNHDNTAAQQLSGLTDIQISYPILSGHVLRYDGIKWYNGFDLADVTDSIRNDIRVTGFGTVWTIVSGAVTYDKLSNSTSPVSAGVKSRVAKAWLNYDGINNIIRSSFNISSVTNLGTGYYRINYVPSTFTDANYSFVATCDETYSAGPIGYYIWPQPTNFALSSTEIKHHSYAAGTTETNPSILSVVVFASGN